MFTFLAASTIVFMEIKNVLQNAEFSLGAADKHMPLGTAKNKRYWGSTSRCTPFVMEILKGWNCIS